MPEIDEQMPSKGCNGSRSSCSSSCTSMIEGIAKNKIRVESCRDPHQSILVDLAERSYGT